MKGCTYYLKTLLLLFLVLLPLLALPQATQTQPGAAVQLQLPDTLLIRQVAEEQAVKQLSNAAPPDLGAD